MIFVTVGTQLPFDRMVEAIDRWAGSAGGGHDVVAQIGSGSYRPRHLHAEPFISPEECRAYMLAADTIVSHAGMGTIISALEMSKPLLVMPRRADLGEHRNDHQVATAARFGALGYVSVATDTTELQAKLDALDSLTAGATIRPYASDRLIGALSTFINA